MSLEDRDHIPALRRPFSLWLLYNPDPLRFYPYLFRFFPSGSPFSGFCLLLHLFRLHTKASPAGLLGIPGSFFHPYPHSIPAQLSGTMFSGGGPPPIKTLGCARLIAPPVSSAPLGAVFTPTHFLTQPNSRGQISQRVAPPRSN